MKMLRRAIKNKRGESLIIVMIIAVVLLTLGAAVLIFASSNLTVANKTADDRSSYYVAKSALVTMNDSICSGETGNYLVNEIFDDFLASGTANRTKSDWCLKPEIDFSGNDALNGYQVKDVTITFRSTCKMEGESTGSSQTVQLAISDMKLSLTVENGAGNSYTIGATYAYSGWVSGSNGAYDWSGTWTTIGVEQ